MSWVDPAQELAAIRRWFDARDLELELFERSDGRWRAMVTAAGESHGSSEYVEAGDELEAARAAQRRHSTRQLRAALSGLSQVAQSEVVQLLVERGGRLDQFDHGSRDTDNSVSSLSGHTWQAVDYADGLVRVGVQSAVARPEAAALLRRLMTERGMPVPPPNRVIESICVVELCQERVKK